MKKSSCIFWSGIGLIFIAILTVFLVFSFYGRNYHPGVALFSGDSGYLNKHKIEGNGQLITINKDLPQFNKISASGSYDITVTQDKAPHLEISTDENIINKIEATVIDGELKVKVDRSIRLLPSKSIQIRISAPELKEIQLAGDTNFSALQLNTNEIILNTAGHNDVVLKGNIKRFALGLSGASNVDLSGVNCESIQINSAGAGDIHLSGTTDSLNINNGGTIDVRAKELDAKNVSVNGAGSTNIHVHVINRMMLDVYGKSVIHYSGNPEIIKHFAGSMKLIKE